jgi:dihydropteroate synthase
LDGLPALAALGRPVLVGLSRKRMIGRLTGRAPAERLAGSLAGLVFAILRGAHIVRVHDGAASLDAARVAVGLMREEREA